MTEAERPLVLGGWQVVPIDPDKNMTQAAIWALDRWREKHGNVQERVPPGQKHEIRWRAMLGAAPAVPLDSVIGLLQADLAAVTAERDALLARINSPEIEDWFAGTRLEAVHQVERYGAGHDAGKNAFDWFWLIGYLSQKAATAAHAGDVDKAKHHTISTAAALLNWHKNLTGEDRTMRPGIDPVARGIESTG